MDGIEVIFGPGDRKVWQANAFYLEQVDPGSRDGQRGSTSQLAICQVQSDESSNSTNLETTVVARVPRWSFVHKIALDKDGSAPARVHEDTGWQLPAVTAETPAKEPLPPSGKTGDGLPKAPERKD